MVSLGRTSERHLLLGEWACLGVLYPAPMHGFAVAARLKPDADVGRVWSLSRALTYRSLEQLTVRGHIHPIGTEPGIAGGNRTVLAATRSGRAALRKWLATPVTHLRDIRSELLLKLVIAENCEIDMAGMLDRQRTVITATAEAIRTSASVTDPVDPETRPESRDDSLDVVALWRTESADAALRFLDRLQPR
jgi:DNA-binding PadR family transcriptional regulator